MTATMPSGLPETDVASTITAIDALHLRRLQVRRAPGIHENYTLEGLSPGVTLVHGPNGSGKSTTARAVEAALWPDAATRAGRSVRAEFDLCGMRVSVDVEGGHCAVQRDGAPWQLPVLPAQELKHRYRLSLHELLAGDAGGDFARQVLLQSSGGLDLDRAAATIGARDKAATCRDELRELDAAARRVKDAREQAEQVHRNAGRLDALDASLQEARSAQAQVRQLDLARQHAIARVARAEAAERVETFPSALASLRGDEFERLCAMRDSVREHEASVAARDQEIADAAATVARLCPGGPAAAEDVIALRESIAVLQRREEALDRAELRADEALATRDRSRTLIGPTITDEQLATIDADEVEALADYGQRAEERRAERAAIEAELRWVSAAETGDTDADRLRDGMRLLALWLSEPAAPAAPAPMAARALLGLGALGVLASAMLASQRGAGYLAGALLALGLAVLGLRALRSAATGSARPQRERDYAALRLATPAAWDIAPVQQLLEELARRVGEHALLMQRRERRDALLAERRELEAGWRALDAERAALAARIGVPADTPEPRLAWLLERIGDWQQADVEAEAARADRDGCARQHATALAEVRRAAERCRLPERADLETSAGWRGVLEALESRVRGCEAAERDAVHARSRRTEAVRQRDARSTEIARLLEAAGLGADGDAELEAWCAQHAAFVTAREALTRCEGTLAAAARACRELHGFDESLLELSAGALAERLALAQSAAGALEALTSERTSLQGEIDRDKRADTIAEALVARDRALAAITSKHEDDLSAMVGQLLVQHVQAEARDRHRPEVFHRARGIFADVTRGRYQLDLDPDGEGFRAVDTVLNTGHTLDELSSATRVQLLLAVRLAFVEAQETSLRLPLLLDELLGTSDDERSAAIVDAVIALARSGRQILYFTAQADEVARWVDALVAAGVNHACIDLKAVRDRRPVATFAAPAVRPAIVGTVPPPDGYTHEEYGELLGVPAIDPMMDEVGTTHLWYLIDDLPALHRLLTLGIRQWGQLEQLEARGRLAAAGVERDVVVRARVLAGTLRCHHEEVRIGRGKPVTREVLARSGAVTPTMLDRVVKALEHCAGDGRALLAIVDEGKVTGFGEKKAAALRAFLLAEGYVDEEEPRSEGEVRLAMLEALSADASHVATPMSAVDDLLARLASPRGSPAASSPLELLGAYAPAPVQAMV